MTKYFKNNNDYFKFINDKKDKCDIKQIKILKYRIRVDYEKKS